MKRKMTIIIFATLIINFICVFFLFKSLHTFKVVLNGYDHEYVSYKADYKDKGFTIYNNKRVVDSYESDYDMVSNVDSSTLGEYKVEYHIVFQGKEYNLERIVEVVDNTGPVIDVNTDVIEKSYCSDKLVTNLEYKATDDIDGDVTDKVVKEEKDNSFVLTVTDSYNNTTTVEIPIKAVDKPSNRITLNGNSSITVGLGSNYSEAGAYYSDGCGNKIDDEITIEGSVDTSKEGKYIITYISKTDNNIKATRTVNVKVLPKAQTAPVTGNSIIYLTFDDGPGAYTKRILDTLDKYNIKATFFVTNQMGSGYQSLIAEEAKRGHTVGIHTLTHKWDIYHSLDNYWNDFNAMNAIVEKQTGNKATILRFPGGTSNRVSKIAMSTIVNSVNAKGYKYYDWNVCVEDAGACTSSSNKQQCVYNYFVGQLKPGRDNIVLLHDIKSYTADSLERMIKYGISKGYTFRAIDDQTYEEHFKPYK